MKISYQKGMIHSSPPTIWEKLSFLPAAILTLTVVLSPEDQEILAYLISCPSSSFNGNGSQKINDVSDHFPHLFHCNCFRCYKNYWVRWNSSSNHLVIHNIIDDFEDFVSQTTNKKKEKKNSNNNKLSESTHFKLESVTMTERSSRSSNIVGVAENEEKLGMDFVDVVCLG
ncbi:hypothetical protein MTR_6g453350 [Medicago truncatula]|uniref:Uncharacterized protein n=1 Tax=Medicago truncatula TaxID=3880 RepID=A0A072U988_MEDTR|nr:hypothetical protein MTR_6g453350 [Medicago truncatula]